MSRVVTSEGPYPAQEGRAMRSPDRRGRGWTGNVIAALASFFVPGLGQLLQGRVMWALFWFLASIVWWIVTLGLLSGVVHVLACLHAALYRPKP